MRLVITVLLLVVLPTALLSVLAGRSIQAREVILDRRLAQDAVARLDDVSEQTDRRVHEALAEVTRMFRETVLAGADVKRLDEDRLTRAAPPETVQQVFLFMNPWGYIYPETGASNTAAVAALHLQPVLVRALAGGDVQPAQGRVIFRAAEKTFCFEPIAGYRGLYAGIELNVVGMRRFLDRLLQDQSTASLRLAVMQSGADAPPVLETGVAVQVSDSLGLRTDPIASAPRKDRHQDEALAARALNPPLDDIDVAAFVRNVEETRRAHALQVRLIGWGILLLAVVISASAVILIAGALRQADRARRRSEFMAGMSHDLRTPVAAMRMMAESLLAGRVANESRRQEFLDAIITECDRLGDLIERIMFYFRQEQGALRYDKRLVEPAAVAASVVERFRRQHAGRLQIRFVSDGEVPPVFVDPNALEKALTNLIDNAVKYGQRSAPGGKPLPAPAEEVQIDVIAGVRRSGRRLWTVLTVRDRGDGIAPAEHRRIFERFYRVPGGAHAHRGGFGLGLSLVADIMKAHRGWIRVANAPDGGAVFELWLKSVDQEQGKAV